MTSKHPDTASLCQDRVIELLIKISPQENEDRIIFYTNYEQACVLIMHQFLYKLINNVTMFNIFLWISNVLRK